MNPSTAMATVLIDELVASGVTDAVLCPGSRNAPLSVALHRADAAGRLRLHVRIDERTAGFLALGLARGSARPVPVVTTSGTAVANLYPAVLEAHHSRVPLLVLSADRPPRLRDVGANQVIDQLGLFSRQVLRFQHEFGVPERGAGQNAAWRSMVCRALGAAVGASGDAGPVQLNLPLDVPLLPDGDLDWPESLRGRDGPWTRVVGAPIADRRLSDATIPAPRADERCLIVADVTHPLADEVASAGYPVLSEAGGLAGGQVLAAGIGVLGDAQARQALRPDRVIVLGRPTLYRAVTELLASDEVPVDVVDNPVHYADLAGIARHVAPVMAPLVPARGDCVAALYAAEWHRADLAARRAISAVLAATSPQDPVVSSAAAVRVIAAALPHRATLVLGSSQVPRDIGLVCEPRGGVRILANRGVAGIDGTISSAMGIALAGPRAGAASRTVALMGDLAFLHDTTGLAIGPDEPRPDLTVVVINNDGGGIFATLEPGEPIHAAAFERVFGTPIGASIRSLADAFGVPYRQATTVSEIADAIADAAPGLRVVEIRVPRSGLRDERAAVHAAIHAALMEGNR